VGAKQTMGEKEQRKEFITPALNKRGNINERGRRMGDPTRSKNRKKQGKV